ncbi:hypothetical protein GCM10023321_24270 [Pseudonocardia eucalypti]|uniref:Uncharacterized protein n=1 Tax=Pseudonocardia eucalypti TaxID=648755 RepID=A0ABP9PXR1_9PSEU|nr:DNA-binding HxlR family transcriptional regulator [Pseudonocardia eucalypti]
MRWPSARWRTAPRRFGEPRAKLPGISPKALTQAPRRWVEANVDRIPALS